MVESEAVNNEPCRTLHSQEDHYLGLDGLLSCRRRALLLNMSRLEDPEFTIKDALIITNYPGATPEEVTNEVTDVIESAAQELGQLDTVESINNPGQSIVTVEVQDKYGQDKLQQVWDELRRKVNDAQVQLPPGAETSMVIDDFGDVYGILLSVTGEGYPQQDIQDLPTISKTTAPR